MLKLMRESSHSYPWLLKSIMGIIALAFVITMGWWGFGEQTGAVVASVGDLSVSRDEFRRAYENTYRFYKDKVPGEFKDETIKQLVAKYNKSDYPAQTKTVLPQIKHYDGSVSSLRTDNSIRS